MSDLRRFWQAKPEDLSMDDLLAFFDTLPSNSATKRKQMGVTEDFDTFLLSVIADRVTQNTYSRAGKKLPEKARMSTQFVVEDKKKTVNKRLAAAAKAEQERQEEKKKIAPATFTDPAPTIAEKMSEVHEVLEKD